MGRGVQVYCIIDNISELEGTLNNRDGGLEELVRGLLSITAESDLGPRVKLLMTSASQCTQVVHLVPSHGHASLQAGYIDGGLGIIGHSSEGIAGGLSEDNDGVFTQCDDLILALDARVQSGACDFPLIGKYTLTVAKIEFSFNSSDCLLSRLLILGAFDAWPVATGDEPVNARCTCLLRNEVQEQRQASGAFIESVYDEEGALQVRVSQDLRQCSPCIHILEQLLAHAFVSLPYMRVERWLLFDEEINEATQRGRRAVNACVSNLAGKGKKVGGLIRGRGYRLSTQPPAAAALILQISGVFQLATNPRSKDPIRQDRTIRCRLSAAQV